MLVDPYLRLEQLAVLVQQSTIDRILIRDHYRGSKEAHASMGTFLLSTALHRQVEVRVSEDSDVHDRYLLTDQKVDLIGYSLNGVEQRTASTTVVTLPDGAAEGQRQKIESWWTAATALVNPTPHPDDETGGPGSDD